MNDIQWDDLNWFGRFVIRFHNIVLGPEFGFSPAEVTMITRWGKQ